MRRGRKTKREEIQQINAAMRWCAMLSDKPGAQALAETLCRPVPKQRAARKPSGKPLEADILRDILKALRAHPAVATVERRQSGVFQDGNRYVRVGQRGLPDISGMLHGGRTYAIEVKRPGRLPDDRQAEYLTRIQAAGGCAGVASSISEAIAIIERVHTGNTRS